MTILATGSVNRVSLLVDIDWCPITKKVAYGCVFLVKTKPRQRLLLCSSSNTLLYFLIMHAAKPAINEHLYENNKYSCFKIEKHDL